MCFETESFGVPGRHTDAYEKRIVYTGEKTKIVSNDVATEAQAVETYVIYAD